MNPVDLEIIVYSFFLLLVIIIFVSMFRAYFSAAPWCPTRKKDWDRIIKIAKIKDGDIVYDFGSGTGCVASYIGKKTGAKVIGLEMSLPFYLWSKVRNRLIGSKNVDIQMEDFFSYNISKADFIFCFLTPRAMKKLGEKFKKELPENAKVISYAFEIFGWQPELINRDNGNTPIYLYKI